MPNHKKIAHANDVTPAWVLSKMEDKNVTVTQLVKDTGCNQSVLSCWIRGRRNMSQGIKAMFYYYFNNIKKNGKV